MRAGGSGSRWFCTFVMAAVLSGCAQAPPPPYVRLAGEAPRLTGVPSSPALLVVFWASWCAPCRVEAPSLRRLADRPPEGLAVVVFGHDESDAAVNAFFGGPPPASWRLRPDTDHAQARRFGVEALPASILVVDGRLVARFAGPREWDSPEMRRLLERLASEGRRQGGR